jgi:hypothetical protein
MAGLISIGLLFVSTAPALAEDGEPFEAYVPAVAVDGTIEWDHEGDTTQSFEVGDGVHTRDFVFVSQLQVNDERLNGVTRMDGSWDDYPTAGAGVVRGTFTITTDDGAWEGPMAGVSHNADHDDWQAILLLTGSGAYEGLSATLFFGSDATVEGTLYDSRLEPQL